MKIDERQLRHGTLTLENFERFTSQLEAMLAGKLYTFVVSHEMFNFKPRTRVHQRLSEGGVSIWYDDKNTPPHYAGFNVSDSYGVWVVSTDQMSDGYDPKFNAPHFSWAHPRDLTITHRADSEHLIYWQVIIE